MIARLRPALSLALLAGLLVFAGVRFLPKPKPVAPAGDFLTNALRTLQAFEAQQAERYWAPELMAEKYGAVIEQLWDRINASSNRWEIVAAAGPGNVVLAHYPVELSLPYGIKVLAPSGRQPVLARAPWEAFVRAAQAAGWELAQCEFRHTGFSPPTSERPASSKFYFSAHLANPARQQRAILEGDLRIEWAGTPDQPVTGTVDASALQVRLREGPSPFRQVLNEELLPREGSYFIDPLIAWDLDRDGTSEIILAAANRVYRRGSDGLWSHSPLCEQDPGLIFTGVLGDFDGDGTPDFLCAKFDGLFLYAGTPDGRFPGSPRQVWAAQPRLKYAQAIAVGDVDGDGDIDLFLGQYKVPYDKGQMPRPYFDANDGHPSFLLENDGKGNFADITQRAGLGAKRGRRVYNASFVDLDRDGRLDLLVASDFAGLDVYRNEGGGRFKDVTGAWFPEAQSLGMAQALADFDRDGNVDVFLVGMNSPTADRLASLHLNRPYDVPDEGRRSAVTFGNRLLFGTAGNKFQATALSSAVARTGWSWGCAAADFDNDGFPDLYIANGHETRQSVRDYESEFWLHDIYVGDSTDNALAQLYFREKMLRTRGRGWSYGGYEKNRFFLNLGGTNFVECAYLLGVALESDSRNVIAEDLDGDGRLDLIVTTFEIYPKVRQTLQIFRNELPVRERVASLAFRDLKRSGTVVQLGTNQVEAIQSTGSYRSQTQPVLHLSRPNVEPLVQRLGLAREEFVVRPVRSPE